jgi:DNA-binding beta-propeller fold protein YncE
MNKKLMAITAVFAALLAIHCGDSVTSPDGGSDGAADGSRDGAFNPDGSLDAGKWDGGPDGSTDAGQPDASDGGETPDGGDGGLSPDSGPAQIYVEISPPSATAQANIGTVQFLATAKNATDPSVAWTIKDDPGDGSFGTVDNYGLYKAPAAVPLNPVVTVAATSVEDSSKSAASTVKVTSPVGIAVSPKTAGVKINEKWNFAATLEYASNKNITWEVIGGNDNGTISYSGTGQFATYTAPAAVPVPADVTIKATSQMDPSKSDTAVITVRLPVKVTVSPNKALVSLGFKQQFTAVVENASQDVEWKLEGGGAELGTIDQTGLYTAPLIMPSTKYCTIRATSKDDPTASGLAQVSILPPIQVYVSPDTVDVAIGLTAQFTAVVANATDTSVTWSIVGNDGTKGSINSSGLYTAPASIPTPDSVTIMATSNADPAKNDTAVANIKPFVSTFAGSSFGFKVGNGIAAQFGSPAGVSIDNGGNLFVADTYNNRIRRFTLSAAAESGVYCGSGDWGPMSTDYVNCTSGTFGSPTSMSALFFTPGSDTSVRVYIADTASNVISRTKYRSSAYKVRWFSGNGTSGYVDDTSTSSPGGRNAEYSTPTGIVASPAMDYAYVADFGNNRIRRVWLTENDTDGRVDTKAGSTAGFTNGTGTAAKFNGPYGVALDSSGNIYVGDFNNHAIRKVTTAGVVTTVAGNGTPGSDDGDCANARFYNPAGVAVDTAGNIYVADSQNHVIRRITFAGGCKVSTLAGGFSYGFVDNCAGPQARFNKPTGVAVTADGNSVYVADQQNNRIRLIKMGQ